MSSLMSVTGVKPWDVLYTSLPLYHSAGFLCFTSAIERGTLDFTEFGVCTFSLFVWVLSGFSGFLPQTKSMHVR